MVFDKAKVDDITAKHYNTKSLNKMVDKILDKFGGLSQKDYDDLKTVFLALTVVFAFILITSGISVVAETDSAATLMVLMKFLAAIIL